MEGNVQYSHGVLISQEEKSFNIETSPQEENPSYLECPVCFLIMSAPGRVPMVTSCGHTICRQCLDRITTKKCPICNKIVTCSNQNYALNEVIESYLQTHTVFPESNPPSDPPAKTSSTTDQPNQWYLSSYEPLFNRSQFNSFGGSRVFSGFRYLGWF